MKTEHTMIALLYSPTAMPVLDFGLSARHCIINWDSKSDDVKTAKRQLLRVLETNKLPTMNVSKLLF